MAVFYNSHRLKEVNLEAKKDTGRHTEQTFCNPLPLSLRFYVTNRLDMSMLLASNWQLQAIPHTDFQINRESICTWIVVILFATPHSATKCCSKKATIRIRAFLFHKDHKWCHFVGGWGGLANKYIISVPHQQVLSSQNHHSQMCVVLELNLQSAANLQMDQKIWWKHVMHMHLKILLFFSLAELHCKGTTYE